MRKQNKNKNKRSVQRRPSSRGLMPPPIQITRKFDHTFRFSNGTNSGTFTITRANLLNLLLLTPTATTSTRLFEGVRLRSVEIWSNPSALGSAPTSVSLEWVGENAPSTVIGDTTMGVRPAHVFSSPPALSSCAWWSLSGTLETDPLFTIVVPTNSIIDVQVSVREIDTESPTGADVPAGATVGQVYGDYLDGLTSGKLAPVGYTPLP
jgi:hypothetical protein